MRVQSIFISDIHIPPRRREDYGNLEELADSISQRGLLQPIVVAAEGEMFKLAAGERRLKACSEILGWPEIPARIYSDLSEDERLLIELEENLQRKDLTPYEQSKNLVQTAQVAEKIIQSEFRTDSVQKSKGRPEATVSTRKVAERIGVPKSTIQDAKQHVAAVETYPELKTAPQKQAIETAKALDKLPEQKREQARSNLSSLPLRKPSKPPIPKPSKRSAAYQIQEVVREVKSKGGLSYLARGLNQRELFSLLDELSNCHSELGRWVDELTDSLNDSRAEAS